MSDTPETNVAEHDIDEIPEFPFVSSNFARRLERERNKLSECAEALNDIADILDMPTGTTTSEIVENARSRWATGTKQ